MGGGIRTPDRRFRKPMLYPTELRPHMRYTNCRCSPVWQVYVSQLFLAKKTSCDHVNFLDNPNYKYHFHGHR